MTFAPVFTVAGARAIEARAAAIEANASPAAATRHGGSHAELSLMSRAGAAAARCAIRQMDATRPGRVLAVAGPGNNGGDAIAAASVLRAQGLPTEVLLVGDAARLPADAANAARHWQAGGGTFLQRVPHTCPTLILDGLFGIGLSRAIDGDMARLIEAINQLAGPVLALDVPSGIQGDSGAIMGCAIRAAATITFIGLKPGLLTLDGPDHAGVIEVASLDLSPDTLGSAEGILIDHTVLAQIPTTRPRNFHKGHAGTTSVLGGASGMVGAALLSGLAALRLGAGKVLVGLLGDDCPSVDATTPELMLVPPAIALLQADVIAAGPGLGTSLRARTLLAQAIARAVPIVLDADALTVIARDPRLQAAVSARTQATLLTPHPAEAARLLGTETARVQHDRLGAAQQLACRFNATVILKGNGSIVAAPRKPFAIIGSGNPGMAAAGMGDCLTGILAALLAQGADPLDAARAGAWLHGAAGDRCAARLAPIGISATEVANEARHLLLSR